MIKIAIAEDNSFLARSIINKLGLFDDFKVKFHAVNGVDLMAKLAADSNVDIILMDVQMPEMDGVVATKEVSDNYPHIKVVMLTVVDDNHIVYQSLRNGAVGYLLKESSPQYLYDGILNAVGGEAALSPSVALKAIKIIQNPENFEGEQRDFGLSDRELQVLCQMEKGLSYRQIASNLIISPNTVRRHIDNIYRKLEVSNKVEAIQKAYVNKLI
ncbi:MAG: response regulator transcription factor [Flavobacteriales bacterium]|nr:response regulator transcription factor [Flavobacteriales bacterium]